MQKNYNAFVKWIAISAVVVFVGIFLIFRVGNEEYTLETFFGDIGFTTGIVVFFATAFNFWLWRLPFIGRWSHTPDLRGVWKGKGRGESERNNEEYNMTLKIRQTYLETHIHAYFDKSQSDSFSSVFIYNDTIGRTCLVYSYQNDPKLIYRNKAEKGEEGGLNIHYGTTKLDIDFEDLHHLTGSYWNDRECVGTIELTKEG